MDTPQELAIIGVASPYAWEVVESASRLGLSVRCVDNFGGADARLPGLVGLDSHDDVAGDFTLGLSSAPHRAIALIELERRGFHAPRSLIDPTAIVASTVTLGHCGYVNAGAVIGSHASVGCAVNINRSASIGHDNVLGFSASIAPGAVLAGGVTIEAQASVGAGAVVLPGVTIGRGAIVGAGAVVTRDVAPGVVVVGNPAKPIRDAPQPADALHCPYCLPR